MSNMFSLGNRSMEQEEPKTDTRYKICFRTASFSTFHIDTHHQLMAPIPCTMATFVSKYQVFVSIFATIMVRSTEKFFAIENMAAQGTRIKKIAETGWGASEDDKAVAAPGAL